MIIISYSGFLNTVLTFLNVKNTSKMSDSVSMHVTWWGINVVYHSLAFLALQNM
jgi:hypothetical protein